MAAWLIPALKAVLPHIGTIISTATPVFTKKQTEQQISELQSAVSQNAANIKELAAQLQSTLAALEQAALTAEANLKRTRALCIAAMVVSIIALCGAWLLKAP